MEVGRRDARGAGPLFCSVTASAGRLADRAHRLRLRALRQDPPRSPTEPDKLALVRSAMVAYAVATLVRRLSRAPAAGSHNSIEHRASDTYARTTVGYAGNNVLPARGGELLRVLLMSQCAIARKRHVLGSEIAVRVLDAVAPALILIVFSLATSPTRRARRRCRSSRSRRWSRSALSGVLPAPASARRFRALRRHGPAARTCVPQPREPARLWAPGRHDRHLGDREALLLADRRLLSLDMTLIDGVFLLVLRRGPAAESLGGRRGRRRPRPSH